MLKERFNEIDLKITELADYLQISRPTMYKFIDMYEEGNYENINKKVVKLFDYISDNELIGKKNVINYILTKLVDVKELGDKEDTAEIKSVKKYLISNPDSEKAQFIINCSKKSGYDIFIHYIMEIIPLIKKKDLTEEEINKLKPYYDILNIYKGEL